ncbi:hypothetical protein [Paraburkholderia adhaesiva]|uniref:hypothetical protein n=1 Tax=Paraburkholderia adhaesiva TaxID=2883244 RepID=UPI001F305B64|nr:hypothetical protein [Paraburkholderia adhaesiva]
MSSHSRRARERIDTIAQWLGPENPEIDAWVPDYGRKCEACGATPCVTGLSNGQVVYEGPKCGACMWGEAVYVDPLNW